MKKILIIEDDKALLELYKEELTSEGFEVACEVNGKSGLNASRDTTFDIIILDIMLPGGMNGFEVLEFLKKDVRTKDIPVLVLTNLGGEEKTARDMGVVDYLMKVNTTPGQLAQRVIKILA